jgi:hypothetical protein
MDEESFTDSGLNTSRVVVGVKGTGGQQQKVKVSGSRVAQEVGKLREKRLLTEHST